MSTTLVRGCYSLSPAWRGGTIPVPVLRNPTAREMLDFLNPWSRGGSSQLSASFVISKQGDLWCVDSYVACHGDMVRSGTTMEGHTFEPLLYGSIRTPARTHPVWTLEETNILMGQGWSHPLAPHNSHQVAAHALLSTSEGWGSFYYSMEEVGVRLENRHWQDIKHITSLRSIPSTELESELERRQRNSPDHSACGKV